MLMLKLLKDKIKIICNAHKVLMLRNVTRKEDILLLSSLELTYIAHRFKVKARKSLLIDKITISVFQYFNS